MVDPQTVCCMCGDVGFPDKLFRCINCRNRFQHSYCSNYYTGEVLEACDWCQSEGRNSKAGKSVSTSTGGVRSNYSGEKIKRDRQDKAGKSSSNLPRTSTRRYKLLKDVMC